MAGNSPAELSIDRRIEITVWCEASLVDAVIVLPNLYVGTG